MPNTISGKDSRNGGIYEQKLGLARKPSAISTSYTKKTKTGTTKSDTTKSSKTENDKTKISATKSGVTKSNKTKVEPKNSTVQQPKIQTMKPCQLKKPIVLKPSIVKNNDEIILKEKKNFKFLTWQNRNDSSQMKQALTEPTKTVNVVKTKKTAGKRPKYVQPPLELYLPYRNQDSTLSNTKVRNTKGNCNKPQQVPREGFEKTLSNNYSRKKETKKVVTKQKRKRQANYTNFRRELLRSFHNGKGNNSIHGDKCSPWDICEGGETTPRSKPIYKSATNRLRLDRLLGRDYQNEDTSDVTSDNLFPYDRFRFGDDTSSITNRVSLK
ncbi:hypothetical protein WDU94_005542 [Cyamophila willieti]